MQVALGRWVWHLVPLAVEGYWAPPAGAIGGLDLRPLPAQATPGLTEGQLGGFGIFAFPDAAALPATGITRTFASLDAPVPLAARTALRLALGFPEPVTATTVRDLLVALLTTHADLSGVARVRALQPDARDGKRRLWLAGHLVAER
jgi:hypothetical protein